MKTKIHKIKENYFNPSSLKRLRIAYNLTEDELAQKIGVPSIIIKHYECGFTPSDAVLKALQIYFNKPKWFLLGLENPEIEQRKKQLSENIKAFRKEKNLTRFYFSLNCDLSLQIITLIENKKIQPSIEHLYAIAAYMDTTVEELYKKQKKGNKK